MPEDVKVGQTVFVTDASIKLGIQEGRISHRSVRGAFVDIPSWGVGGRWVPNGFWHLTLLEAVAKAEAMRDERADCHEAEAARLRALTF